MSYQPPSSQTNSDQKQSKKDNSKRMAAIRRGQADPSPLLYSPVTPVIQFGVAGMGKKLRHPMEDLVPSLLRDARAKVAK